MLPRAPKLTQAALVFLALASAVVGGWALFLPESCYRSFPGLGHTWVMLDGPYNEHLVRDVGALNLGLGALAAFALVRPSRATPWSVGLVGSIYNLPHFVYHVSHIGIYAPVDQAGNIISLGLALLASLWLLTPFARLKS